MLRRVYVSAGPDAERPPLPWASAQALLAASIVLQHLEILL